MYFIHEALLRLAMQLSRTIIHRIAKNCLEIREMLRTDNANVSDHCTVKTCTTTNIGKKTPKKPEGSWIYPFHPCAPGQWFEFAMHPDYHLQMGHLHYDVILLFRPESFRGFPSCAN